MAAAYLGVWYAAGCTSRKLDKAQALFDSCKSNIESQAQAGDAEAMTALGLVLHFGGDKDFEQAKLWFEKAADLGNT